ncbi:hypothetical protein F2Q68_00030198 [Brassica cretica]|uniref:Uncharacterized protein n=1 Tax=Brassica cretica TaxID=69181 RepID=A0A8S9GES6_BRACR|nr:hypothetical protein F2Q68_00030198 [Brassica cretica]
MAEQVKILSGQVDYLTVQVADLEKVGAHGLQVTGWRSQVSGGHGLQVTY